MIMSKAKELIMRLADQNIGWSVLHYSGKAKPGDGITRLSPEQRTILEGLKSDDIANVRSVYIPGGNKGTTSVFSYPEIKESE